MVFSRLLELCSSAVSTALSESLFFLMAFISFAEASRSRLLLSHSSPPIVNKLVTAWNRMPVPHCLSPPPSSCAPLAPFADSPLLLLQESRAWRKGKGKRLLNPSLGDVGAKRVGISIAFVAQERSAQLEKRGADGGGALSSSQLTNKPLRECAACAKG